MDVVTALADLVAFPTVSDRPVTELAAWLAQHAEDAGMRVERFETEPGKVNVVASAGPQGTDGVVLSGHMDVVPVAGQPWTRDPFVLVEDGGRLYGRGSCDMKAFLAATTCALAELPLAKLQRELVLMWTHDEEVGCHGSAQLAERLADRPVPSLTLIGEPTGFQMCRAHPGHTTVEITCTGRAAHSSRPQLGTSAIQIAADVLAGLDRLQRRLEDEPVGTDRLVLAALPNRHPVLNCGAIHGGTAVNIVPDHCVLSVGVRQLPGQTGAELVGRIDAVVEEVDHRWRSRGGGAQCRLLHEAPALLTPAGTALEDLLRPHASDPHPGAAPFATDGGNLARLGTQSIVFGPGSIDVAHKADEYVPVDQLLACVDVVRDVVSARCLAAVG